MWRVDLSAAGAPAVILAHFLFQGEEREAREVEEQWLRDAFANHDNILLTDGNTYRITGVSYDGQGTERHARVQLAAPQFARGS